MQTRRFLNYHPKERFKDNSYIVFDGKDNIVALVPACKVLEDNTKLLYSHKGSTFGGIITDLKSYKVERIISIIESLEKQISNDGFDKIVYKQTPDVYSKCGNELFEYAFYYFGYTENKELGMMIDYAKYGENTLANLSKGKKYNVNQCKKNKCKLIEINSDKQVEEIYHILCINLKKYNATPIHTLSELLYLKNECLKNECAFLGITIDEKIIAGAMMFYFNKVNIAHTQYLCTLPEYNKLSPMSFLYYSIIEKMKNRGFSKLTWGISTEEQGRILNLGLAKSKESFGGGYTINRSFVKNL